MLNLAAADNARLLVACNAGSGSSPPPPPAAWSSANLIVESRGGGANDGEVTVNYGFQNLSNKKLKHSVEPAGLEELQQVFAEAHAGLHRQRGAGDGARGPGAARQAREYNCVCCVLWGIRQGFQARVEVLEGGKGEEN